MTRLFVFLAALILYLAPPVAQAFASFHVRPPGAALAHPISTDTELTRDADTELPWGVIAAWVQAVGTIAAFGGAIYFSSRDHRRSINIFAEERRREEGIRHLRAHSLAHALYPDLLEAKAKIGACEAVISRQRAQRNFLGPPQEITQNLEIEIPESLQSAGEMFYLLGTDTAPGVSQLLSLLHQHNRAASKLIEELNDEKTFDHALAMFWNEDIFTNRFQLMKEDVESTLNLVRKIRDKELLPEYTSKAENDHTDNVADDDTAIAPDDTGAS